jgi:hypothetical protein
MTARRGGKNRSAIVMIAVWLLMFLLTSCSNPFSAEQEYVQTIVGHTQRTLSTISELNKLAAQPKLTDSEWISEAETQLNTLRYLVNEAYTIVPPERFETFPQQYLSHMDTLKQVTDKYEQAMEFRDNEVLQQALSLLEKGKEQISNLRMQAKQLKEQLSEEEQAE